MRYFLLIVGLFFICAFSPAESPVTSPASSPVISDAVVVEEVAATEFSLSDYTTQTVACEINANNTSSYPGTGQEIFDLSGNNCDFYLGNSSDVDTNDPTFTTGVSYNYFDFPNDDALLNGTEFMDTQAQGLSVSSCMGNIHRPNTETTIISVFGLGDVVHASNPLGFSSSSAVAQGTPLDVKQTASFTIATAIENTSNQNVAAFGNGSYGFAYDEVIYVGRYDNNASDYEYAIWTNSPYADKKPVTSYGNTPTDSQSGGDFVARINGNKDGGDDTLTNNATREGWNGYFACVEGLMTDSEIANAMDALCDEFSGLCVADQGAGKVDFRTSGIDGVSKATTRVQPAGISFSSTGQNIIVISQSWDEVEELSCPTPYCDADDISTVTTLDVSADSTNPAGISWNGDDTGFIIADNGDDAIEDYDCPTAGSIVGCTHVGSLDVSAQGTILLGATWANGNTLITVNGNDIDKYTCTTAYVASDANCSYSETANISTASNGWYTGNALDVSANADVSQIAILDSTYDDIALFNMSTPNDLSTISFSSSRKNHTQYGNTGGGIYINYDSDGSGDKKAYFTELDTDAIYSISIQ